MAGLVAFTNAPPSHNMVLPALVPVKVDVNTEHVILPELIADVITGKFVLEVTATVEVVLQPFIASIEDTVYVPGKFTVGVWVFIPVIIPGPAQV